MLYLYRNDGNSVPATHLCHAISSLISALDFKLITVTTYTHLIRLDLYKVSNSLIPSWMIISIMVPTRS